MFITRLANDTVQVVVTCPSGDGTEGSGVIISASGRVLTAYHVVEMVVRQEGCTIRLGRSQGPQKPPGRFYEAALVAHDAAMDLALLRITGDRAGRPLTTPLPYAQLATQSPPIGSAVHLLGFPALTDQLLAYDRDTIISEGDCSTPETCWILTEAFTSWGSSGGPAFDDEGRLIGLATGSRSLVRQDSTHRLTAIRPIAPIQKLVARASHSPRTQSNLTGKESHPLRLDIWQVKVVGPHGVNWRTEPSTTQGKATIKATWPPGTTLNVIPPGKWKGWWATVDDMGDMGWVKERVHSVTLVTPYLGTTSPQLHVGGEAVVTCLTQAPCASLIYSPGYGGNETDAVIDHLAAGVQVKVIDGPAWVENRAWWNVRTGKEEGWLPEITRQGYRLLLPVPQSQP